MIARFMTLLRFAILCPRDHSQKLPCTCRHYALPTKRAAFCPLLQAGVPFEGRLILFPVTRSAEQH
jgi:hypothetical protein